MAVTGKRPMTTDPGDIKWLDGSAGHDAFAQRLQVMCRAAGIVLHREAR